MNNDGKHIYLANPRGFCAGVKRAIDIVDKALEVYGAPLYVLNEIVHNDYVVDSFKKQGVIFIHDISEVPTGSNLIFSAHGVCKKVENDTIENSIKTFDATCPLVKKIHHKAAKLSDLGYLVLLVGHKKHPEVIGTLGQVTTPIYVIEDLKDAKTIELPADCKKAILTQTTLSDDDTREIIATLKERFPDIEGDKDICYATQNRQNAVKTMSGFSDTIFIIGSIKSSNSNRLREVALKNDTNAYLINSVAELKPEMYQNATNIGISAGASAPECLIEELVEFLKSKGWNNVKLIEEAKEDITFSLPVI